MMDTKSTNDEQFKPYGTIAFMVVLFILTALVWFSVYYIQIDRT
ncbi:cytochrome c oxidase subunit 2A [Sphingobacterium sp. PCS056]|jgi:hypothetical protein|nr:MULTISPECIES: cytochrome c oxidase subunit 2A [Sphingobacterium]UPZ38733.1 cytochrome c oxidase subunit 2A [Sphingobacterium sp. PCS056]UXD70182.1 cytochrome c oxidase subunit 2A [Sphingobacterium faecium]CDT01615.1 hypothetical protein BN1088_1432838 [Sphingobacterium sp. PM2-P1-29]